MHTTNQLNDAFEVFQNKESFLKKIGENLYSISTISGQLILVALFTFCYGLIMGSYNGFYQSLLNGITKPSSEAKSSENHSNRNIQNNDNGIAKSKSMTPLTPREDDLIKQLSFDPHIGRALKDISSQSFYRMKIVDPANFVDTIEIDAICISEKREVLTNYYEQLYESFVDQGYIPFLTHLGSDLDTTHIFLNPSEKVYSSSVNSLAVIKHSDKFHPLTLMGTNGANYDLNTTNIIQTFSMWEASYGIVFQLVEAYNTACVLLMNRIPEEFNSFFKELKAFCPDIGDSYPLTLKGPYEKEVFHPHIGEKILVLEEEGLQQMIKDTKILNLWWD